MNNEIVIIKSADAGTWLKEKFTPSGIVRMFGESFIGEYADKMSELREIDDQIETWRKDLGVYLDAMERAYNSKRVVDFISVVTAINKSLRSISSQKDKVTTLSEESLQEFEKERLMGDPSTWSKIKNFFHDPSEEYDMSDEEIRQSLVEFFKGKGGGLPSKSSEELYFQLVKNAGWLSDWKREWVYKRLQSKQRKERDAALKKFFNETKNLINKVKTIIDDMHSARAYGEIGRYLDGLRKISNLQLTFEKNFKSLYEKHLKSLMGSLPPVATEPARPGGNGGGEPGDGAQGGEPGDGAQGGGAGEGDSSGGGGADAGGSGTGGGATGAGGGSPSDGGGGTGGGGTGGAGEQGGGGAAPPDPNAPAPDQTVQPAPPDLSFNIPEVSELFNLSLEEAKSRVKIFNKEDKEKILNNLTSAKLQVSQSLAGINTELKNKNLNKNKKNKLNDEKRQIETQIQFANDLISALNSMIASANDHFNFIKKLASCKNQYDAAHLLLKYSSEIEDYDLNASLKLLALAEGILDA